MDIKPVTAVLMLKCLKVTGQLNKKSGLYSPLFNNIEYMSVRIIQHFHYI